MKRSSTLTESTRNVPMEQAAGAAAPRATDGGLAGRLVRGRLTRLKEGRLELVQGTRTDVFGDPQSELRARATVRDDRFWDAMLLRGSVGAGEAWFRGWWTSDDPVAVVRVFVRNLDALERLEGGLAWLSRPFLWAYHLTRPNTRKGSQENISAHYDLSNEFFALFLDESMTYSAGIFERPEATLAEAQAAKLERICRKLDLGPEDHLLEIGTGWGSLAIHAASRYGCRVTTTTISREQHDFAARRIREAGLEDRIELVLKDYRDLEGTYTKAVSVEMIEAVGARFFGTYFEQVGRLLAPDGLFLMQAITIADQHFERARRAVDFIQRYVFPGCCIPSVQALLGAATDRSDLRLVDLEDITTHYATTLRLWRERLNSSYAQARALGLTHEDLRLWEFYFAYCEGGFAEGHLGDVHLVFARPGSRPGTRPTFAPAPIRS